MNIGSLGAYASKIDFGKIADDLASGAQKTLKKAPKLKLENPLNAPYSEFGKILEKNEALISEYKKTLDGLYFDEKGNLAPEIQKFLDETIFEIKTGGKNGTVINTTIKDYLRQSIHTPSTFDGTLYHGTLNPKNIDNIIANGFDINKISSSRTRLGPGFYFSSDYGIAREYGSVLKADAKGIIAGADNAFYENVPSSKIIKQLGEMIGLTPDVCDDQETCYSYPVKFINEYVRKFIVEKLGIDALSGWGGNSPVDQCICVLNPKILSNVQKS